MNVISEMQIPEKFEIKGLIVNPRQRLNDFIKGQEKPIGGYYIKQVKEWLLFEGNLLSLNLACGFY